MNGLVIIRFSYSLESNENLKNILYFQILFRMKTFGSGLVSIGCEPNNNTIIALFSRNNFKVFLFFINQMKLTIKSINVMNLKVNDRWIRVLSLLDGSGAHLWHDWIKYLEIHFSAKSQTLSIFSLSFSQSFGIF